MARSPSVVGEELGSRLPGLAGAIDVEQMEESIREVLLDPRHELRRVSAGSFWLREDGTCSLRYTLRLADDQGQESEHVLLARVHPDDSAAQSYLHDRVRPLLRGRSVADGPWATPAAVVPRTGVALHPFPADPELPTLVQAMSPRTAATLVHRPPAAGPPSVHVVHHPRVGPCVLRYDAMDPDGEDRGSRTLYGKVYPDPGRGAAVDSFLRALGRGAGAPGGTGGTFPRPTLYAPRLRLLLTEALPGEPAIPRLLASVLSTPVTSDMWEATAALRGSVRAAGEALGWLHASDLATAPVHTGHDEQRDLRHGLVQVAHSWPETARRVLTSSAALVSEPPEPRALVLSHGDFTPAQVLVDGASAAVVDLDTLCWADPALDLGRFLAHLELLAAKHGERAGHAVVRDLGHAFLAAYGGVSRQTARAAESFERIAFYRSATLTRTALNASRQLKAHRLELALSLLESETTRRADL
jgi:hypothetical protein